MDRVTLGNIIQDLREQLELSRIQDASLENDADRRARIAERTYAIRLLFDLLERRGMMAIVWEPRPAGLAVKSLSNSGTHVSFWRSGAFCESTTRAPYFVAFRQQALSNSVALLEQSTEKELNIREQESI